MSSGKKCLTFPKKLRDPFNEVFKEANVPQIVTNAAISVAQDNNELPIDKIPTKQQVQQAAIIQEKTKTDESKQ